jgi:UDP-N-acetylmuramoylalanine--D-glutamate ligase
MTNDQRPIANTQYPISALIVGLAREGTALARFLAGRGIRVTVTDAKPAEALAEAVAALADLPVTLALGGHPPSLLDGADILFVSPGVPLEIPFLAEARQRGLPLSSETRLFTRLCPAPIVGITGSSGKTTTTALAGEMLETAGRRTWVGGNIGRPLIGHVDEIEPGDVVVMELSSFQLEFFAPWTGKSANEQICEYTNDEMAEFADLQICSFAGWSPAVAAVLNVTPNHLDRHPSMEAYIAAKAHILNYQRPGDVAVLNLDNAITRDMAHAPRTTHHVLWFSLEQEVEEGTFLRGDELVLRLDEREAAICRTDELKLLGRHNVANVLAACALAAAAGAPVEALRQVATTFAGVEHRLELVRERNGVRWYNDSIATSPERTVAALNAFDAPLVLLAGGRDKHLPWADMAALTLQKVRHLILFGEAADLIDQKVQGARGNTQHATRNTQYATRIHHAGTLARAVEVAAQVAQPGDVVLLSPGGTSFDAYRDFVARGEHFRQLVNDLE